MKKKKVVLALALTAALAAGTSSVDAWAHGHGGGHHRTRTTYELCDVEDCNIVGLHKHDGTYYCGHFIGDGHDYHEVCTVEGCLLVEEHEHDGVICLPCAENCTSSTASCYSSSRRRGHCH